jgi:hypothetical protein
MKIIIYILMVIAVMIALTFVALIYRQQVAPVPEPIETPVVETEVDIAKRIILQQINTSALNPEDKRLAEASALKQVEDDARLYEMAMTAGTKLSDTAIQFAWQRELYNHTDEAGLAAYIASLGLTEDAYRALVLRRLTTATFTETKAAARISDEDVRKYYDALPPEEQEDFEMMELEIREKLAASHLGKVREELLAS